jgi:hypothetical protein
VSETAGAVTPRETIAERVARIAAQRAAEAAATPDILSPEQLAAAGFTLDSTAQQRVAARLASDAVAAFTREQRKLAEQIAAADRSLARLEASMYVGPGVLTIPRPEYLIADLLDMNSLAIMYGPSGSFKSFLALDMYLRVTAGLSWQGNPVHQGRGLYIAAEGTGDIGERVAAWKSQYRTANIDDAMFLATPVNLFDAAAVDALRTIVRRERPVFIVIDTLARSMSGGDENSAKDASIVIEAADSLKTASGACVLLVHHSGYDATHARGSTAFRGACDTELSVKKTDDGLIVLRAAKQKTRRDGDTWFLKAESRETSLVIVKATSKPTDVAANAIAALQSLADHDDGTGMTSGQWELVAPIGRSQYFAMRRSLVANRLATFKGKGSGARYSVTDAGKQSLPVRLHVVPDDAE